VGVNARSVASYEFSQEANHLLEIVFRDGTVIAIVMIEIEESISLPRYVAPAPAPDECNAIPALDQE
jgi:hypothetical protein